MPFIQAAELIREALEIDRGEFWGDYASLAESTLKESVKAAELKVAASIASAKATFEERFGDLGTSKRDAAIATLEANQFSGDEEQAIKCPSCGFGALATGEVQAEWRYAQIDHDEFEPTLNATFYRIH